MNKILACVFAACSVISLTPAGAQILDIRTVVASSSPTTSGYAEVIADCPAGMTALSGGADSNGNYTVTTIAPVFGSTALFELPDGQSSRKPTGWYASFNVASINAEVPPVLRVAVQCAIVNTALTTVVVSGTADLYSSKSVSAVCPIGSTPTGGGIDVQYADDMRFFTITAVDALTDGLDVAIPSQKLLGWRGAIDGRNVVFIQPPDARTASRLFKVGAVCVAGLQGVYHNTATASGVGSTPSAISACPAGHRALGGGMFFNNYPRGTATLSSTAPDFLDDGLGNLMQVAAGVQPGSIYGWYARTARQPVEAASPVVSRTMCLRADAITGSRVLVEFYNSVVDYYFITSRSSDMALLDSLESWTRTGVVIPVYTTQVAGTQGIGRYYFDRVARNSSRGSHFYTLVAAEKTALAALNPGNRQQPGLPYNEGVEAYAFTPAVEGPGGRCAAGQAPVYRLFRGGANFPDDPNHRFTSSLDVYNEFVAAGWDGEGVKFCVGS